MSTKKDTTVVASQPVPVPVPVSEPSPLPPVTPTAVSRGSEWLKYVSILAALFIVAATTVALYSITAVRNVAQSASEAFQPKTTYMLLLSGEIGKLKNSPKLVVLTAPLNASVTQETKTTVFGYNVSSAKVEVRAPAVVQYVLQLKDLNMNDLYYDQLGKRLVVTIPHPTLDQEIVEVESDPSKIQVRTEFGWSPLSLLKGGTVREEAMHHLKDAAIELGRHELLQERADKNAKETVSNLMSKVRDALKLDDVRLDVEFKKQ